MNIEVNSIKNIFLGTTDRVIATISIAITLIGTVATIFTVTYPEKIPYFLFLRDIVVVFCLVAIIMFLLVKTIKQNMQLVEYYNSFGKYNIALYKLLALNHNVTHSFRDESVNFFSRRKNGQPDKENYRKFFDAIAHSITLDCQKTFLNYLCVQYPKNDFNISVSIKIITSVDVFEQSSGKKVEAVEKRKITKAGGLVYTAFRDPETHEMQKERETNQNYYMISLNTAFDTIYNHKHDVYANDNLTALGATYKNENSRRSEFYNATIVAPLRWNGICFGFMAVDSLNPDGLCLFQRKEAKEIIATYADLMASCVAYSKYI